MRSNNVNVAAWVREHPHDTSTLLTPPALTDEEKRSRIHYLRVANAGTLTTPGLDRGKSCVGLRGVSPRDGYLAQNTTQGTQENLPTVAEVTASIRA